MITWLVGISHAPSGLAALIFPWYVCVLLLGALIGFCVWLRRPTIWVTLHARVQDQRIVLIAIVGLAIPYVVAAVSALTFPGYIDPGEPMIATASYRALTHIPVYSMLIPYGPYCYLPYALAIRMSHSAIWGGKLFVLGLNLILIWLLYLLCRSFVKVNAAVFLVALTITALLMKESYLFQLRGDVILFVAVATSFAALLCRSYRQATLLLGLAVGVAIGIKITAFLYVALAISLFTKKYGLRRTFIVFPIAFVVAFLPFIFPSFSLLQYATWLRAMSHEARNEKELLGNLVIAAMLFLPPLLVVSAIRYQQRHSLRELLRGHWVELTVFGVCTAMIVILGGKVGAGRHYLAPLVINCLLLSLHLHGSVDEMNKGACPTERLRFLRLLSWAALGSFLIVAAGSEAYDLAHLHFEEHADAEALAVDIRQLFKDMPTSRHIELGDGEGEFHLNTKYSPMYGAPAILMHGGRYTFDPSAEADRDLMHLYYNAKAYVGRVKDCKTVWLIPRGEQPFHTLSIYSGMYPTVFPGRLLFSNELRTAFAATYIKVATSQFYDVYSCRIPEPRS